MSLSADQKNQNILNRFETQLTGTSVRRYTVGFSDGKKCTMICMHGESVKQALFSAQRKFGADRIEYVKA